MSTTKNNLTITGRITEIGTLVHGETWKKQDFTIETLEQYSKLVNLHVWNDKIDQLTRCLVNDVVICQINISSRKHEDRYYTEATCWKLEVDFNAMRSTAPAAPTQENQW
jgi:DNA polymerase III alpha subunit